MKAGQLENLVLSVVDNKKPQVTKRFKKNEIFSPRQAYIYSVKVKIYFIDFVCAGLKYQASKDSELPPKLYLSASTVCPLSLLTLQAENKPQALHFSARQPALPRSHALAPFPMQASDGERVPFQLTL